MGTSFQTPGGQTIQRPANQYEPFAAIINTASNYVTVADNAAQRRATIKDQIAQTTQQLQNATTDAEVQKLHGVLTSLNGDLASTDDEVNQAASSAMVQDIQNRNDQQKQIQALTEQQNAEFTEAVSNYTAMASVFAHASTPKVSWHLGLLPGRNLKSSMWLSFSQNFLRSTSSRFSRLLPSYGKLGRTGRAIDPEHSEHASHRRHLLHVAWGKHSLLSLGTDQ